MQPRSWRILGWSLVMVLVGNSIGCAADRVTLVQDGQPRVILLLPEKPTPLEQAAATDLVQHLEQMSGAKLTTANVKAEDAAAAGTAQRQAGLMPVFLGSANPPAIGEELRRQADRDGAFMLKVQPEAVYLVGNGEGTAYAVSELLEQQGVRWFMPGRLGTVIPTQKTVTLSVQTTVQTPSFAGRNFQLAVSPEWPRRLRCGGANFPSCHGLPGISGASFKEHPEYFSELNGKRVPAQLCVSNPDVLKAVIAATKAHFKANPAATSIGMGPNDGSGFCQCANCRALDGGDYDAFSGEPAMTDRYVWFFNQVLAGIRDEYPNRRVCFYVYHTYMRPPVKVKPDPLISGALAPITLCRVHGPNNPVCVEAAYYQWLVQEWGKLIPELWDRGYWSNLACPGFPFIIVHRLREQIPYGKAHGIYGWRVETFPHWGTQLPSFYIAAKLMWNADANVDALLQDFYTAFGGPAAAPLGQYVTLMDAALRDADYHTGCSWNMPQFYPAPLRQQARALLTEAAAKAQGQGIYAERIQMVTETFDLLEAFITMLEARSRGDLPAAQTALTQLDTVGAKLLAYDPPMIGATMFKSYMRRFYRKATEEGAARVAGGNQAVAVLKDEWDFLADPTNLGETLGWWRAEARGGNWQHFRTCSASWSDQGLRYYKGLAWYRQRVTIPADVAGKTVRLWCGGVDESARVWVNGELIGDVHKGSFVPFELDVTKALRAGAENTVVMQVANHTLDELGTGGIVAPVILYVPAPAPPAPPPAPPPAK